MSLANGRVGGKHALEAAPQRPKALRVKPEGVPADLKGRDQWVCWRYERRDGKWTKRPVGPKDGRAASSTDPATWAPFDKALAYYDRHNADGEADGIGFVFAADDPFAGVDLDDCRDPDTRELEPWAAGVIADLDTYAEVSPSRTGVKLFLRGKVPPGRKRQGQVEMYDNGRFFVVTGRKLADAPATVNKRQGAIDRLHAQLFAPPTNGAPAGEPPAHAKRPDLDDDEIIRKASAAKNGAKFTRLCRGDTGDYDGDDSAADQALCNLLAFWTRDPAQIDRLFRRSKLYREEKWGRREDYRRRTIAKALEGRGGPAAPPDPEQLARLQGVLDAGGAAALFGDKPLLQALADLAVADPPAFAARRAALKGRVSLRDLDKALQHCRRQAQQGGAAESPAYFECDGRIHRNVPTKEGAVPVPLCNFTARIVEDVLYDDGAERTRRLALVGTLAGGAPLPRADVPAEDFPSMNWVVPAWGTRAVVYAGQGTKDHLRAGLQLLSGDVPRRTVYRHTGWRELDGHWVYLHAGGAVGAEGPAGGVEVALSDFLDGFRLPDPPGGDARVAAVRASLKLLERPLPRRLTFPLLGAVCRAALGDAPGAIDLSLYLAGPHGVGKSELAALAQQHYGQGLDARHLPGSWSSTANALEGLAFAAKDALFTVDDYAPRGGAYDRQRLEREADRLLRAQGNRAGRQRMCADGGLRPVRPPRGLILSTGEDVPAGQSLRGRMLILEVSPEDVPLAGLTPYQRAAAAGLYARALAAFVCWLAPRYGNLRRRLPDERAALRDRALAEAAAGSARTPGIVADLALGLNYFLDFAEEAGAVTAAERDALATRGWKALVRAAAAQAEHVAAAEPAGLFLRLLDAAIASGRAHVANPHGRPPRDPDAWGWRGRDYVSGRGPDDAHEQTDWTAQGKLVGWLDGQDGLDGPQLYLEPQASFAAAHEMAREQGEALPVSPRTLHRRLKERGFLASWDGKRQRSTVRRSLGGSPNRDVLHLRADALSAGKPSRPSRPSTARTGIFDLPPEPADGDGPEGRPSGRSGRSGRSRPNKAGRR